MNDKNDAARERQRDLEASFGLPEGGHGVPSGEHVKLTPEQEKARKRRNVMLALGIGAFMVLVFLITIAQIREHGVSGP